MQCPTQTHVPWTARRRAHRHDAFRRPAAPACGLRRGQRLWSGAGGGRARERAAGVHRAERAEPVRDVDGLGELRWARGMWAVRGQAAIVAAGCAVPSTALPAVHDLQGTGEGAGLYGRLLVSRRGDGVLGSLCTNGCITAGPWPLQRGLHQLRIWPALRREKLVRWMRWHAMLHLVHPARALAASRGARAPRRSRSPRTIAPLPNPGTRTAGDSSPRRACLLQQLVHHARVLERGAEAQLAARPAQVRARVGQRDVRRVARRGRQRAPLPAGVVAAQRRRACRGGRTGNRFAVH